MDDDRLERELDRRLTLRTRRAQGLMELMTDRSDLQGIHASADLVVEGVRWSV